MKYEFTLKYKLFSSDVWRIKYHVVVPSCAFNACKSMYEKHIKKDWFDSVLLINKLDDNGDFIEVVQ